MLKKLISDFKSDKYKILLTAVLLFLVVFSPYALKPQIAGDSLLYVDSISVLKTNIKPPGFEPMMILTTPLGLSGIMFFDLFFKNLAISWLVLDSILYVMMGLFFYSLLVRILRDRQAAFLGTLFLVTNYAAVVFGLGYLMDMGGWAFYMASIYFSYRYLEDGQNKWLYVSSALIGLGGLYKEYAFVAYLIVFAAILWKNWREWKKITVLVFVSGVLAFTPFLLANIYTYTHYNHYTYLNWFNHQKVYAYQDRLVEFIKSLGSIYNFAWFLFIPGLYGLLKRYKEVIKNKDLFFIWLVILSGFAALLWPVVTRVLFIAMPGAVLVTTLFIEKVKNRAYVIWPILFIYIFSSFLMDAFILDFVNINPILHFLHL